MANLNKGTTFVSGGEVTAAKLNDMVDNATITDITATDLASNNAMVTIGTAPANKAGNLYFDNGSNSTFGAKNGELLVYSGGMFHSAAENVETVMTFLSTESPVVGSVMTLDTTTNDQVKMSSVANDTSVVGVVAETSSTKARVVRTGYAKVKCNGSLTDANRGNYLVASGTAGEATTASIVQKGAFGRVMSVDISDPTVAYAVIYPVFQQSSGAERVELTTTAKRPSSTTAITDQDLGSALNNYADIGTIGHYQPTGSSSLTEVWLDILVVPQVVGPIQFRIEGDLSANEQSSTTQYKNVRMFEYSSTSLATTLTELRDYDTDLITDTNPANVQNSTPLIQLTDPSVNIYLSGLKLNRTYTIENTATTPRHFKILTQGGNSIGSNNITFAGVLIFEQWKVV